MPYLCYGPCRPQALQDCALLCVRARPYLVRSGRHYFIMYGRGPPVAPAFHVLFLQRHVGQVFQVYAMHSQANGGEGYYGQIEAGTAAPS